MDDGGVFELRGRACLLGQPRPKFGLAGKVGVHQFEGDGAVEVGVICFVHRAHPAIAQQGIEAVLFDVAADKVCHGEWLGVSV